MKKNPFYSLRTLEGVPCLLPFGQNVAAQRRGAQFNEASVILWQLMDLAGDGTSLAQLYMEREGIEPAHRDEVIESVAQFLSTLESLGVIESEDVSKQHRDEPVYGCLRIGPLSIHLHGDASFFSHDFDQYLDPTPSSAPDQVVSVSYNEPPSFAGAVCLIENTELTVYRDSERFYLVFPVLQRVRLVTLSPDGRDARLYVRFGADRDTLREELFHVIRHVFLYIAQQKGFFVLHAASILYRDRVWLFSAPSGTGKSTQASLWQNTCGTPILNGDLALLGLSETGAVFYPLPWCGTSGISVNRSEPLGGVILLRQASKNTVTGLPPHRRQLMLANRMISPVWTAELLDKNLAFADALSRQTAVWRFDCTKEPAAVDALRDVIDGSIVKG